MKDIFQNKILVFFCLCGGLIFFLTFNIKDSFTFIKNLSNWHKLAEFLPLNNQSFKSEVNGETFCELSDEEIASNASSSDEETQKDFRRKNFTSSNLNNKKFVPVSICDSPFMTAEECGRLGNNICELMTLLLFRFKFGIRVALSSKISRRLRLLFETIPVPHLPHPCFLTNDKSSLKLPMFEMYKTFKLFHSREKQRHNISEIQRTNNLDMETIADVYLNNRLYREFTHYNYISGCPCPLSLSLMEYRKLYQTLLPIRNDIRELAKMKLVKVISELNFNYSDVTLVSTHIRRTDYLTYVKTKNYTLPTEQFYKNAFNFYRKKCNHVLFVVISDDLKWAKEKLSAPDVIFPGDGETIRPEVDFTIITLCDHHIMGLGTFGLTSAVLGKGTIVKFEDDVQDSDVLQKSFSCVSSTDTFIPFGQ